jgi:hypothetical protein
MRRMARTQWALGLALACIVGTAASAQEAAQTTTHTSLTAVSGLVGNHTAAIFTATVEADGAPAKGAVTLVEGGKSIASASLDEHGVATLEQDSLLAGNHHITAVYSGDGSMASSSSEPFAVHIESPATPDFALSIAPTSLNLTAGTAGTSIMTITPLNGFTGFLSLSCSGLPIDEISCTFTPANLQVVSASTPVTASLGVLTTAPGGKLASNHLMDNTGNRLALAILLPGIGVLGFLGRKRKMFGRIALVALVGILSITATTACSARYNYLHHGPVVTGTPSGSYTITVTAQTSNGVTATEHSTTLSVTVK